MQITENRLRRIVKEELLREGWMDNVRSFFGGEGEQQRGGTARLAAAVPETRAMRAFGITPKEVADWAEGGRSGDTVRSRTSPASFGFGSWLGPRQVGFMHPRARIEDVEERGLRRLFQDPRDAGSQIVSPLVPEKRRGSWPRGPYGAVSASIEVPMPPSVERFDDGKREQAMVEKLGVDFGTWQRISRMQDERGRQMIMRDLLRALALVKVIDDAYEQSMALWGDDARLILGLR
jgi:hypothetical protein